jgi:hypothetical protein
VTLADIPAAYAALRELMLRAAPGMVVTKDEPGDLVLVAPWNNPLKPKEPMFFGGVRAGKAYASFHLFPLYVLPELKESVPESLARRMQGKTCFNFKAPDTDCFAELEALTREGARRFAHPFTSSYHAGG